MLGNPSYTPGPWALCPKYPKSQGPRGRGPEVLRILGPRPQVPVCGPKVRGPKAQGLMAIEPPTLPVSQVARLKSRRAFEENCPSNAHIFVILPVFLQSSAR